MVLELCWLLIEHPMAGSRRTPVTESTRIGSEIQVQAATLAVIQTISNPHIRRDGPAIKEPRGEPEALVRWPPIGAAV
jgi:hypothetical protein